MVTFQNEMDQSVPKGRAERIFFFSLELLLTTFLFIFFYSKRLSRLFKNEMRQGKPGKSGIFFLFFSLRTFTNVL
jgi:hypothetical protein